MGRFGITYPDVTAAIQEIIKNGDKPTVDKIRERLGTGSKSTILPYLRQWRSQYKTVESSPLAKEESQALRNALDFIKREIEALLAIK